MSGSPGSLCCFPPSSVWLTSGRDSFTSLSNLTSAQGLSVFGGNGGGLQGIKGEGVPCEWTSAGSRKGIVGVPESWGSAGEGV